MDPITGLDRLLPRFGIRQATPMQRAVIAHMVRSADEAAPRDDDDDHAPPDLLAHLPTGAGKSLCFMAAGLLTGKPSLVIYPLVSLMEDQKRRFDEADIEAGVIRGGQDPWAREKIFHDLARRRLLFVLASPEVLEQEAVAARLEFSGLDHAVIDEAHTVVQWGLGFRPAYASLGARLQALGINRVSAFSATAGPTIRLGLGQSLFMGRDHTLFEGSMDRQNLTYRLFRTAQAEASIAAILDPANSHALERPAIVFCRTRKGVERLAQRLHQAWGSRVPLALFHAGLSREEKCHIASWFHTRTDAVLVGTCAFGLGVDKKDVRTVIHHDLPDSVEAYLQESGRAGRDGKPAQAVALVSDPGEGFSRDYTDIDTCRRRFLLERLCGSAPNLKPPQVPCCDRCAEPEAPLDWYPSPGPLLRLVHRFPCVWNQGELARDLRKQEGFATFSLQDCQDWIDGLARAGIMTCSSFPLWPRTWHLTRQSLPYSLTLMRHHGSLALRYPCSPSPPKESTD